MTKKKEKDLNLKAFLEEFALAKTEADELIMSARDIVFK